MSRLGGAAVLTVMPAARYARGVGLSDLSDPGAVIAAMDERDRIGEEAFLTKYKSGQARQYFVMRDGVAYDSKAIAAAAHGYQFGVPLDPAAFSGGKGTVQPKLEALGFEVRDTARTALGGPLSELLEEALSLLPQSLEEEFKDHLLARLLVRAIPETLALAITEPGYKIQGSPGRGRWAATVWVSIFDRLVTTSAQNGYYLVYLFREDGAGVYFSLNQGTTAVHAEVGGRRYLTVLRDRATVYGGLLGTSATAGLELGAIDLGGEGRLTRGYEAANIAAFYYPSGAIPEDEQLFGDLHRMLALYRDLVEANDYLAATDNPGDGATGGAFGETPADAAPDADLAIEAKQLRWHLRAERNPNLARDAKRIHGTTCAVCGFNYGERYGELGDGYIEAHHLTPFAELSDRPTQLDPARDFAVLCASCHRMVHRHRPPYELDAIRAALKSPGGARA